jgi:hypothetical protein
MKSSSFLTASCNFSMTYWSFVHQPDFAGAINFLTGEKGDGGIDGVLLLAEVEDIAVGLGAVEHAIGAGEGLNQPWCFRFLST